MCAVRITGSHQCCRHPGARHLHGLKASSCKLASCKLASCKLAPPLACMMRVRSSSPARIPRSSPTACSLCHAVKCVFAHQMMQRQQPAKSSGCFDVRSASCVIPFNSLIGAWLLIVGIWIVDTSSGSGMPSFEPLSWCFTGMHTAQLHTAPCRLRTCCRSPFPGIGTRMHVPATGYKHQGSTFKHTLST